MTDGAWHDERDRRHIRVKRLLDRLSEEQRYVLGTFVFFGAMIAFLWMCLWLAGDDIARMILDGRPFKHLQRGAERILADVPIAERQPALEQKITEVASRITIIYFGCFAIVLSGSLRQPHLFREFFSAASHPLNLALLRIAFFLTLYPRVSVRSVIELSQLDPIMRVMPPGLGWFGHILPESPVVIQCAYVVFQVACLMGLLGFRTRTACAVATVMTFYMLGVPQLFGKIHHQHHLIWVGALLAASQCGDALSIDSLLGTLRGKAPHGQLAPSVAYGVPLRFIWLFLGLIYFFPGFWKYVVSGNEWFLSDNLQRRMMLRLFVSEGWEPIIRMDRYTFLCQLGGLTTIVMEMAFVFLIFLPRLRYLAAAMGLLFHGLVRIFLNISFWPIQVYYLSFVDWHRVLQALGSRLGLRRVHVHVGCSSPTMRWVRAAQTLDLFGQIDVQASEDDRELSLSDTSQGQAAFRQLARGVPLVRLAAPLILRSKSNQPLEEQPPTSLQPAFTVGVVILLSNVFCGFTLLDSWPVGVYPTFATIVDVDSIYSLTMVPLDAQNNHLGDEVELLYDPSIRRVYPRDRLPYVLLEIARKPDDRRLLTLWNIWVADHPEYQDSPQVGFYIAVYSVNPEDAERNPIQRSPFKSVSLAARGELP